MNIIQNIIQYNKLCGLSQSSCMRVTSAAPTPYCIISMQICNIYPCTVLLDDMSVSEISAFEKNWSVSKVILSNQDIYVSNAHTSAWILLKVSDFLFYFIWVNWPFKKQQTPSVDENCEMNLKAPGVKIYLFLVKLLFPTSIMNFHAQQESLYLRINWSFNKGNPSTSWCKCNTVYNV